MAEQLLELKPYPKDSASSAQASLTSRLSLAQSKLWAKFVFKPRAGRLAVPPSQGQRQDELWKHTCFELFLKPAGANSYIEVNVRPSGDWNVYSFTNYREGMRVESKVESIEIKKFEMKDGACECEFVLDLAPLLFRGKIEVGVTAVIELEDGNKSYWALAHAGEKPDFHLAKSFTHKLEA